MSWRDLRKKKKKRMEKKAKEKDKETISPDEARALGKAMEAEIGIDGKRVADSIKVEGFTDSIDKAVEIVKDRTSLKDTMEALERKIDETPHWVASKEDHHPVGSLWFDAEKSEVWMKMSETDWIKTDGIAHSHHETPYEFGSGDLQSQLEMSVELSEDMLIGALKKKTPTEIKKLTQTVLAELEREKEDDEYDLRKLIEQMT